MYVGAITAASTMTFLPEAELGPPQCAAGYLTYCWRSISQMERQLRLLSGMREPHVDVTGYGLLLWSLRRPNKHYLSCQLGQCGPDFALLIRDRSVSET